MIFATETGLYTFPNEVNYVYSVGRYAGLATVVDQDCKVQRSQRH